MTVPAAAAEGLHPTNLPTKQRPDCGNLYSLQTIAMKYLRGGSCRILGGLGLGNELVVFMEVFEIAKRWRMLQPLV